MSIVFTYDEEYPSHPLALKPTDRQIELRQEILKLSSERYKGIKVFIEETKNIEGDPECVFVYRPDFITPSQTP